MKRLLPWSVLLATACGWTPPCPTVSYTAGSIHSVTVEVAESLLADPVLGARPGVCLRLDGVASYDQVDQPDAEVALAERVAADPKVVAVVGQSGSRGSLAAAPVYARVGIPQIVPTATSHLLRVAGPWTFVLVPPESLEAGFLAAALDSLGARRVTVFYSGEPYGEGMNAALPPALALHHLAIVDAVRLGEDADVRTLGEASLQRHPTDAIILLTGYDQAGAIAKAIVATHPRIRLIAADGAFYPNGLRRVAGAAAESLYLVSIWRPDSAQPVTRRFLALFRRIAGRDPTPSEALGVEAMLYARAAIAAVGPSRAAVRGWLAGPGGAAPPPGGISSHTLHDGGPPEFALVRLGPPPATPPGVR